MEKDRTEYFKQYRLNHIEDFRRRSKEFRERQKQGVETHDEHYYHSIEELKEAEERGEGAINWSVWHKLVAELKEQFNNMTFPKHNSSGIPKWVYQASTGKLLGHYENTQEVADAFKYINLTNAAINYYAFMQKPYYKHDLYFSNEPVILEPKNPNDTKIPRLTAAYDLTTGKLIALFKTATEAEEYFQMPKSQVGYCIRTHNGVYKKKNLRFEYQSI